MNTQELYIWYNLNKDIIETSHEMKLQDTTDNISNILRYSLAYHAIKETAMLQNIILADCQLNILVNTYLVKC